MPDNLIKLGSLGSKNPRLRARVKGCAYADEAIVGRLSVWHPNSYLAHLEAAVEAVRNPHDFEMDGGSLRLGRLSLNNGKPTVCLVELRLSEPRISSDAIGGVTCPDADGTGKWILTGVELRELGLSTEPQTHGVEEVRGCRI